VDIAEPLQRQTYRRPATSRHIEPLRSGEITEKLILARRRRR
jgi:hypothetical protein